MTKYLYLQTPETHWRHSHHFFFPAVDNAFRMYTPDDNSFDRYLVYVKKPHVTFRARTCESLSVLLIPDAAAQWWRDGYEVVLGSFSNTKSEIRPGYNSTGDYHCHCNFCSVRRNMTPNKAAVLFHVIALEPTHHVHR